jgi:CBS domain-containing protein
MTIGLICNRDTVIARPHESLHRVAQLMREHHVGSVVIVKDAPAGVTAIGVLTDRDLVVEVLAKNLDPQSVTVGDIMSHELVTAQENDGIWITIKRMRSQGIRRMPVLNEHGVLMGIISVDDLMELLAGEFTDLVKLTAREKEREITQRNG